MNKVALQSPSKRSVIIEITWARVKTAILIIACTGALYVFPKLDYALHQKWRYQKQAQTVVKNLSNYLKNCVETSCRNAKNNLFVTPNAHGLSIDFYNFDDIVLSELTRICMDEYFNNKQAMRITIKIFYKNRADFNNNPFWTSEKFTVIDMENKI